MPAQMKRLQQLAVARCLEEALEDSWDCFDLLKDAYTIANQAFQKEYNDIDPACIAAGLQAQALGTITLCKWLYAISEVTQTRFYTLAGEYEKRIKGSMESLGIVIPDTMLL